MSMSVCLSVCMYISKAARQNITKFSLLVACGCGSVLLWQHCNTSCTYWFCEMLMTSSFPIMCPMVSWRYHRSIAAMLCMGLHPCCVILVVSCPGRWQLPRLEEFLCKGCRVWTVWLMHHCLVENKLSRSLLIELTSWWSDEISHNVLVTIILYFSMKVNQSFICQNKNKDTTSRTQRLRQHW